MGRKGSSAHNICMMPYDQVQSQRDWDSCVLDLELMHGQRIWPLSWNGCLEYQLSALHHWKMMTASFFWVTNLFIAYEFVKRGWREHITVSLSTTLTLHVWPPRVYTSNPNVHSSDPHMCTSLTWACGVWSAYTYFFITVKVFNNIDGAHCQYVF